MMVMGFISKTEESFIPIQPQTTKIFSTLTYHDKYLLISWHTEDSSLQPSMKMKILLLAKDI